MHPIKTQPLYRYTRDLESAYCTLKAALQALEECQRQDVPQRHLTLRPETQDALRAAVEAMEGEVMERRQELKALVAQLQRIDTLNEPEPDKRQLAQEERRQAFGSARRSE